MTRKSGKLNILCIDTNESIRYFSKYKESLHWKLLIERYNKSTLNNTCFKCKKNDKTFIFEHRTKCRLGKERLTDIIPICFECYSVTSKKYSKKKSERYYLTDYQFSPKNLSISDRDKFMSIRPEQRGRELAKYYRDKTEEHKPSSIWINNQVKKACKWIRKVEIEVLKEPLQENKEI